MAARKPAARKPKAQVDLHARGARVRSVFGPFGGRVLIEMSTATAASMFPKPIGVSGGSQVVDAVGRDLEAIRAQSPALADSALAATALQLGFELDHPYNSATSKAMCAKALHEALGELRALAAAAPKKEGDTIDELTEKRAKRHGRVAEA